DARQLFCHCDERRSLLGCGARVDKQCGARNRFFAAKLMNAKILVADDCSYDGQPVKRHTVDTAVTDLPRQHSLPARCFSFAAHETSTDEYFSRTSLNINSAEGMSSRHCRHRENRCQSRK